MIEYYDSDDHVASRVLEDIEPVRPIESGAGYACYALAHGQIIPLHDHPDGHLWIVTSGQVEVTLGAETVRLQAPAMLHIPAWMHHRAIAVDAPAMLWSIWPDRLTDESHRCLTSSATPREGAFTDRSAEENSRRREDG